MTVGSTGHGAVFLYGKVEFRVDVICNAQLGQMDEKVT